MNKSNTKITENQFFEIVESFQVKHRLVEGMGSATADALGLSRAILCNDALVQRLAALQRTENLYRGLVAHAKATLRAFFDLTQVYKGITKKGIKRFRARNRISCSKSLQNQNKPLES